MKLIGRKKPPPPDPRCLKITLRGTQCMLPHLPGKVLCAMHHASETEKLAQ